MIKIGLRHNLWYPFLFVIFTIFRRIVKYIEEKTVLNNNKKIKTSFLMISLMILLELILSSIYSCIKNDNIETNSNKTSNNNGIFKLKLIGQKRELIIPDNSIKIAFLIFFSAYFEIFGFITRRFITFTDKNDDYDEFNAKFRSIEILCSSLLCYFTLRIEILKHQIFSLIIILLSLIILFILEFYHENASNNKYKKNILLVISTSISRAFLDTSEKYLFEVDYINIFKLVRLQEIINVILMSLYYINEEPRYQIIDLIDYGKENKLRVFFAVILILIYAILTAYKNLYRRLTVKEYSPMTRALAESFLDPFLILYGFFEKNFEDKEKNKELTYFIINLILELIMVFFGCVYNELFVLYCCGLQYNTHLEVAKRAENIEILMLHEKEEINDVNDEIDSDKDDNNK